MTSAFCVKMFWRFRKKLVIMASLIAFSFSLMVGWNYLNSNRSKIDIFVVEEHHEVLPYWFQAVDDGILPKQGNTLIHIDGHSDESQPEYIEGMPLFKWPESARDLAYLVQKNDVFIQEAVMTGLIKRVIFIWPSWDKRELEKGVDIMKAEVELGWFAHKNGNTTLPYFCECFDDEDGEFACQYLNFTLAPSESEIRIEPHLCKVKAKYSVEHIRDDAVMVHAQNGWLQENESVILDIDEDFFGVEMGAAPLVKSGLRVKTTESINLKLSRLLCPTYYRHEERGDFIMKVMLHRVIHLCDWSKIRPHCTTLFKQLLAETESQLLEFWRETPSLFCLENDLQLRNAWKDLLFALFNIEKKHWYSILELGFCLNTSPATFGFWSGLGFFQICHGVTTPNNTIVFLHRPAAHEVDTHMKLFSEIIDIVTQPVPRLVTLCRSIRDAYTPRPLFEQIENGILNVFRHAPLPNRYVVGYDENLLGGKEGWPGRYKIN